MPTRCRARRARTGAGGGVFRGRNRAGYHPRQKGRHVVAVDEHPRPDTTLEMLAKLKPVVRADGTVTAGNASGINDGAAAMFMPRRQR